MVTETPTDDYRFRIETVIKRYGFLWLKRKLKHRVVLQRSVHKKGELWDTGDPQHAGYSPLAIVDEVYYRDITPEEFLNEYSVLCKRLASRTQENN